MHTSVERQVYHVHQTRRENLGLITSLRLILTACNAAKEDRLAQIIYPLPHPFFFYQYPWSYRDLD